MRLLTLICVGAVLGLAAAPARAAELDLGAERVPEADPAAGSCVDRLGRAQPFAPDALRALLLAAPPAPGPAAPAEPLGDARVGRIDCTGAAEPDLPLSARAGAEGQLRLEVPDALDAGCYEVAIARGCARRRIPLHLLQREREPGRFVAWLEDGVSRARTRLRRPAEAGGLRVLEITALPTLGGSLVRLALADGAEPGAAEQALQSLGAQPELRQRAVVYRGDPAAEPGWEIAHTGAARLQQSARGSGIRIALIDTGVSGTPPGKAASAPAPRDFTGREPAAGLHGALLAGILTGTGDGAGAGPGLAPGAKLLAFAACRDEPGGTAARCWTSSIVRALDAAVAGRARIALLGFAGPEDALVARALERAAKRGLLLIAPVGDSDDEHAPGFPPSHPAVLGVTAVDRAGSVLATAARGEAVALAAPGVDVQTRFQGSTGTRSLSGSALAAAHVAGAAALLLELEPSSSAEKLRETLATSAADLGAPGPDPVFGAGLIDVCAAARAIVARGDEPREDPCRDRP